MARFKMEDGTVVDTDNARQSWDEDTTWNGNNHISVNTGSQWEHEALYLSAKGRYYLVKSSQWQGSTDSAEFITEHEAATWLAANDHDMPESLEKYAEAVCE